MPDNEPRTAEEMVLEPCPFCGGGAERLTLDDAENFGGDVITCTRCQASSHVEFGRKENLVSAWNTRFKRPTPRIDGDEGATMLSGWDKEAVAREIERYGLGLIPELRTVCVWLADHFRSRPGPSRIDGDEGVRERQAVVAWLRHQSDLGANRGIEAETGTTKRAAFGGGSLALARAADAIEGAEHRTNDNAALSRIEAPKTDDREAAMLLATVAETVKEVGLNGDNGCWVSCTGCHESCEGAPTGPFVSAFGCHLGCGCRECGGIGALWDTADYADMAEWMQRHDRTYDNIKAVLVAQGGLPNFQAEALTDAIMDLAEPVAALSESRTDAAAASHPCG